MDMTNTAAARIARTTPTTTLIHVAKTIEAELIASFTRGDRGTEAHVGQIELMTACTAELAERLEQMIIA